MLTSLRGAKHHVTNAMGPATMWKEGAPQHSSMAAWMKKNKPWIRCASSTWAYTLSCSKFPLLTLPSTIECLASEEPALDRWEAGEGRGACRERG